MNNKLIILVLGLFFVSCGNPSDPEIPAEGVNPGDSAEKSYSVSVMGENILEQPGALDFVKNSAFNENGDIVVYDENVRKLNLYSPVNGFIKVLSENVSDFFSGQQGLYYKKNSQLFRLHSDGSSVAEEHAGLIDYGWSERFCINNTYIVVGSSVSGDVQASLSLKIYNRIEKTTITKNYTVADDYQDLLSLKFCNNNIYALLRIAGVYNIAVIDPASDVLKALEPVTGLYNVKDISLSESRITAVDFNALAYFDLDAEGIPVASSFSTSALHGHYEAQSALQTSADEFYIIASYLGVPGLYLFNSLANTYTPVYEPAISHDILFNTWSLAVLGNELFVSTGHYIKHFINNVYSSTIPLNTTDTTEFPSAIAVNSIGDIVVSHNDSSLTQISSDSGLERILLAEYGLYGLSSTQSGKILVRRRSGGVTNVYLYDPSTKTASVLFAYSGERSTHDNDIEEMPDGSILFNENTYLVLYSGDGVEIRRSDISQEALSNYNSITAVKYSEYYNSILALTTWGDILKYNPDDLSLTDVFFIHEIQTQAMDFGITSEGEIKIVTRGNQLFTVKLL